MISLGKGFYLRAEPMSAALDDAGECKLASVECNMFLDPPTRTRGLPKNFAALPEAGVGARRGLQLADHVDNLRMEVVVDR